MFELKMINKDLSSYIEFLNKLEITNGRASRGRTKLIKLLVAKADEYSADIESIRDPYFKKDEKGELIVEGDHYIFKDPSKKTEVNSKLRDLGNDEVVVNYNEYSQKMKELYQFLTGINTALKETDAGCYDALMDSFERDFEKED